MDGVIVAGLWIIIILIIVCIVLAYKVSKESDKSKSLMGQVEQFKTMNDRTSAINAGRIKEIAKSKHTTHINI